MNFKMSLAKIKSVATLSVLSLLVACGGSSNSDSDEVAPTITSARYDVTFNATWSSDTHPINFPEGSFPGPGAHFSPIVVATHNDQVILWENGQPASPGTQQIAETGSPTTFISEANAAITAGTANEVVRGSGGFASPGNQSVTVEATLEFPQVTFLTMIAPSPDWIGGAHVDSLIAQGEFVDTLTVDVMAYDAGTDSGMRYTSANSITNPRGTIQKLISDPADTSFTVGETQRIGTLVFVKQ